MKCKKKKRNEMYELLISEEEYKKGQGEAVRADIVRCGKASYKFKLQNERLRW